MAIMVSIISPVYDEPKEFIARNIESVASQDTEHEFEHIFIIDNPERADYYAAIINSYHYDHIVVVINSENLGLPGARNAGLRIAKGTFIMLLDADDAFVEGRIQDQITFMTRDNDLDHCYGGYQEIHGSSLVPSGGAVIPPSSPRDYLYALNNVAYCGSNCFKQSLLEIIGYFDTNLTGLGAEDLEFWIRILHHSEKSMGMNQVLYYLGVHSNNMTAKYVAGGQFTQAFEYILEKYPDVAANIQAINDAAEGIPPEVIG